MLAAMAHREPDRVPVDLGATPSSCISVAAYDRWMRASGLDGDAPRVYDVVQQLAEPAEPVLAYCRVDVIDIGRAFHRAGDWVEGKRTGTLFSVQVVSAEGDLVQTGYEAIGGIMGFELFDVHPPEEVAEKCDILSIHLAANSMTKNIINAEVLGKLKPGAFVINTARADVLDYKALAAVVSVDTDARTVTFAALALVIHRGVPRWSR